METLKQSDAGRTQGRYPDGVLRVGLLLLAAMGLFAVSTACRRNVPATEAASAPAPATRASQSGDSSAPLDVFVSILPQAYFVERVGGPRVRVHVLVGPGQSPATYEPSAEQMKALARARVFFRVGVPFEESLVPRLHRVFPKLEICDTRQGIRLRVMAAHHHHHDDEAPGHAHEHKEGTDPHIWLSPRLVKRQAETICDTLCRLDPDQSEAYRARLAAFHADLDALHQELSEVLKPLAGSELFVFHPAYGYFADEYGLVQVPVELEGKEPSPKELSGLIRRAREEGVRVIFVQPQFSTAFAEKIAREIGGAVVPLDPLARDYLENMRRMAHTVRAALEKP